MTVGELIQILKQYPEDADVYVLDSKGFEQPVRDAALETRERVVFTSEYMLLLMIDDDRARVKESERLRDSGKATETKQFTGVVLK